MSEFSFLWSLTVILGPIVLMVVIAWALMRKRRLSASERTAQKAGTERAYREPEEQH